MDFLIFVKNTLGCFIENAFASFLFIDFIYRLHAFFSYLVWLTEMKIVINSFKEADV